MSNTPPDLTRLLPLTLSYLALAFTLLVSCCGHRFLTRQFGEYSGFLLYFMAFFLLLFLIPLLGIILLAPAPLQTIMRCGLEPSHPGRSLVLLALGLPLAILAGFIGSRDPRMQRQYPFAKSACRSPKSFLIFEGAYLIFYYLPWEFVFRGLLFFPLLARTDLWTALAVQTIISTLLHIGHPESELWAALGAGFVFGLAAWWSGSILATWVIHAVTGIATDSFLYRFHHPSQFTPATRRVS
jgi:membrane protease YdiL (CAAX protease family)